jgi:hypothetical protein
MAGGGPATFGDVAVELKMKVKLKNLGWHGCQS